MKRSASNKSEPHPFALLGNATPTVCARCSGPVVLQYDRTREQSVLVVVVAFRPVSRATRACSTAARSISPRLTVHQSGCQQLGQREGGFELPADPKSVQSPLAPKGYTESPLTPHAL